MKTSHFFKIITIITFFCLIISPAFVQGAFSKIEFDMSASWTSADYTNNQGLTHSSGKYLFTYYDITNDELSVRIVSSAGSLEASVTKTPTGDIGDYTNLVNNLKIVELNSTTALIGIPVYDDSSGGLRFYCFEVNVNTYNIVQSTGIPSMSGRFGQQRTSPIGHTIYDNDHYFIFLSGHDTYPEEHNIYVAKYDTTTYTVSKNQEVDLANFVTSGWSWLVAVVQDEDPTREEHIYLALTTYEDVDQVVYWHLDLDAQTDEQLATHPFDERVTPYGLTGKDWFLGGGTWLNGTDNYLWFCWIKSGVTGGDDRYFEIIYHRLRFNITIETAELEAQNERYQYLDVNLGDDAEPCWVIGYMLNRTHFRYFANWDYVILGTLVIYGECMIPDYLNFGITDLTTYDGGVTSSIPFIDETDRIQRDFNRQFQTNIDMTTAPDETDIYFGLIEFSADYDVTFTFMPADDPLKTNTLYTYTATVYKNDIQYQANIIIELDNLLLHAVQTDGSGQYVFSYKITVQGTHTWEIKVFDPHILVYDEEFTWFYQETAVPTDPSAGYFLPQTIVVIMEMIPAFIIVLVPAYTLGKVGGIGGYITGLVIGVMIAIAGSVLPPYALYLVILGLAITFVYTMRR